MESRYVNVLPSYPETRMEETLIATNFCVNLAVAGGTMRRIAIIDDDLGTNDHLKALVESLPDVLVSQCFDLPSGLQLVSDEQFDVVVLDIDLGAGLKDRYGGLTILSKLSGRKTATLVVSGMPEQNLPEVVFSLDAYDFIGKPINDASFSNKLHHALISAQLEKASADTADSATPIYPAGLEKDPHKHFVFKWKGKRVKLTMTQSRLVDCLVEQAGQPIPYATLLKQLGNATSKSALATHISDIRTRFWDVDPEFSEIDSEPGKGYVWKTSA
jgi:DNA-binding response OmpR family regulator